MEVILIKIIQGEPWEIKMGICLPTDIRINTLVSKWAANRISTEEIEKEKTRGQKEDVEEEAVPWVREY